MSLFRVCTWWATQVPDVQANYSSDKILVCRLGLQDNEKDYIVVASQSGYLSIYYPSSLRTEEGDFLGYTPTDLVLECKLQSPILSLVAGKFGSSSKHQGNSTQLAILHPLNVVVYGVTQAGGMMDYGTQSKLQLIVDHQLPKWSFSICKGHFGGIKGKEFICVTHLDGSLTFFEQDGITYNRVLTGDVSIPFPTVYDSKSDAFLRINSCWELQSFSYQEISECPTNSMVNSTWSVCLGESPLQMISVRITNSRTNIMILGESTLINVSDEGNIIFVKKLDYTPLCFHSFALGWYWEPNARLITVVVSDFGRLFIYDNSTLIWAAQLEAPPVAVLRSNLNGLPGGLVTLYQHGFVHVGFLGSEPYIFQLPSVSVENIDFDKAHKELSMLEGEIRKSIDLTDVTVINKLAEKDIDLEIQFSSDQEKCSMIIPDEIISSNLPMSLLTLNFRIKVKLDQLQFTFSMDQSINCTHKIITYSDLEAGANDSVEVVFYVSEKVQIATSKLEIIVSFINKQSVPRVITKTCFLPSYLFYNVISPTDPLPNLVGVTLSYSEKLPTPNIVDLFCKDTKITEQIDTNSESVTITDLNGENGVAVLLGKSGNRLRIQSNSVEAVASVLEILINNFEGRSLHSISQICRKTKDHFVVCSRALPVSEIMRRVIYHREIHQEIRDRTSYMDALWSQFKLFQRCLQSKAASDSVDGLVMLIDATYDELITEGDALILLRQEMRRAISNLNCVIGLIKLVMENTKIERDLLNEVLPAFVYPIDDWTKTSWEEISAPSFHRFFDQNIFGDNYHPSNQVGPKTLFQYERLQEHMTTVLNNFCRYSSSNKICKVNIQDVENWEVIKHFTTAEKIAQSISEESMK